jgi:hypothetical protein
MSKRMTRAGAFSIARWLARAAATIACFVVATDVVAQEQFKTPEDAVAALADAVNAGGGKGVMRVLGPGGADIISSGDAVADAAMRQRFISAYEARHNVTMESADKAVLIIGRGEWPFPIPVVQKDGTWRFDTAAGGEEILYRRIGRNESSAIKACLAYMDAQHEYAEKDRGSGAGAYAQRIVSRPGKQDGLYWPVKPGEADSPLGALVARAAAEGYRAGQRRSPYHGYYYKVLTRQGRTRQAAPSTTWWVAG